MLILATASSNVVNHQSGGTCELACWLTVNTSNHTNVSSERRLSASTTLTNMYFQACDTNAVADFTSAGSVLFSNSTYEVLSSDVLRLRLDDTKAHVVRRHELERNLGVLHICGFAIAILACGVRALAVL